MDIADKRKRLDFLKDLLTAKQKRRFLLYFYGSQKRTMRQIAVVEGVSKTAIFKSIHQSQKKLKNLGKKFIP